MTVQEAKAKFEELLNVTKEMLIEYNSVTTEEQKKALNDIYLAEQIAIECMEKKVAKKPIQKKREHILHYECPCCGHTTLLPYCGNCGQKIDWEEGEC